MFTRRWIYFLNPFNAATVNNYLKFYLISVYHYNVLGAMAGTPLVDEMLAAYEAVHLLYVQAYYQWEVSAGLQKGGVKSLSQLLEKLMSELAEKWDVKVQSVYARDTPEYLNILPNYRKGFQQGGQNSRIKAVGDFEIALRGIAPLSALHTEVIEFQTQLVAADAGKDGKKALKKTNSDKVEQARKDAAKTMYTNLGKCIAFYGENNEEAEVFFDLQVIRDHQQVIFTGTLEPNATENVAKRTLEDHQLLIFKNKGAHPYQVFPALTKEQPTADTMFTVEPNQTFTIEADTFGNNAEKPYINIYYSNPDVKGKYDMHIA